jgi:hypothetical protein
MERSKGQHEGGDTAVEEGMSWAVEKIRELRRNIQKATGKVENVWFGNLLLGILNSALLDYNFARVGTEKSVYLAAWGCRNLLELKAVTKYALASAVNASDLRNELAIDAKELYESMTLPHKASHKKLLSMMAEMSEQEEGPVKKALNQALLNETQRGAETDGTDSQAAIYRQLMVDFGLKENAKPKRSSQIARLIDESEEFDPMFKICSKIMHRTVLSIASTITQGSIDDVIPILSSSSANDLLTIYGLVDGHFKKRGIQPPLD